MDIKMIKEAIIDLENGETTIENVAELANLYIIAEKYSQSDAIQSELSDILPAYSKYVGVKRKYQMQEVSEGAVIKAMTILCNEIYDFIDMLYSCTHMNKERTCIKNLIEKLYNKISK